MIRPETDPGTESEGLCVNDPVENRRNTAFLTVSPESYGMTPDAWPLATERILIAAAGRAENESGKTALFETPGGGAGRVLEVCFPMLHSVKANEDLIRATFGLCREPEEHLLSRYCAVLAEAVAYDYLCKYAVHVQKSENDEAPYEDGGHQDSERDENEISRACRGLTASLQVSLADLKNTLINPADDTVSLSKQEADLASRPKPEADPAPRPDPETDLTPWAKKEADPASGPKPEDRRFRVSLCACCVTPGRKPGSYVLDVFAAGDFRLFLWDGDGLSHIRMEGNRPLSLNRESALSCRRLRLDHAAPFALVLLSDSVCAHDRTGRAVTGGEGTRWLRDRLKLEERLHRIILGAAGEETLGAQARQQLGGLAAGQDSVSGGFLIPTTGDMSTDSAFEDFRHVCMRRSGELQELLALLPESYDETATRSSRTCMESERDFAATLFRAKPGLEDRLTEYLTAHVTARLDDPAVSAEEAEWGPCPEGSSDPLHRLTGEKVRGLFRRLDAENDTDRDQAEKNRALISRMLREHWVTLRPLLCSPDSPLTDPVTPEIREEGDRLYADCIGLNNLLEEQLKQRLTSLNALRELLSSVERDLGDNAAVWAGGAGDQAALDRDLLILKSELPDMSDSVHQGWAEGTERYLSLRNDYLRRREELFDFDTKPRSDASDGGSALFCSSLRDMTNGTMTNDGWQECQTRVSKLDENGEYADMFRVLPVISRRIAVLEAGVRRRDARRRCITALTTSPDRICDCLRAAVYRDSAWGEDVGGLIDEGTRLDYQAVVRRWHDEDALYDRRSAAYRAAVAAAYRFGDRL